MEIRGKKTLITGAASGIGRATAIKMSGLGARLFLMDIDADGLEETCRAIEEGGDEVCFRVSAGKRDHWNVQPTARLDDRIATAQFAKVEIKNHQWRRMRGVHLDCGRDVDREEHLVPAGAEDRFQEPLGLRLDRNDKDSILARLGVC